VKQRAQSTWWYLIFITATCMYIYECVFYIYYMGVLAKRLTSIRYALQRRYAVFVPISEVYIWLWSGAERTFIRSPRHTSCL